MYCLLKCIFPILLSCILWNPTRADQRFNPGKGDRIVILGNTFADRMRHHGYFETMLQQNYPDHQLTVRNMGWSADEVGLQPRPLNFPGFPNSEAVVSDASEEVKFKNYKFEGERIVMPVALNLNGLNQDLFEQKPDYIFLCFGMNESFKGAAGLKQFESDLASFVKNLSDKKYNGKSAPQLILVSPIAHENLGAHLPNPVKHNQDLLLYANAMRAFANKNGMLFIDLFTVSQQRMSEKLLAPITINGIHLTDKGYGEAARWMGQQLGLSTNSIHTDYSSISFKRLKEVVKMKDDHFFYRWRAVNGEYIYGRRREPFGVLSFPSELKKINRMTASLDSLIWRLAKNDSESDFQKAKEIIDERGKPTIVENLPKVVMTGRQGAAHAMLDHAAHQFEKDWPTTTEKFMLPPGYEINLFASEKDFPIEKPVAMNFDAKGRLWVATMPTYPQYLPGIPVHDRIVILEDTDGDGKADKHTVFADNLYLPLGFEFYDGGVLVSQEPDLLFLKDTDGDDVADVREVLLSGFGSEDSHHAAHAFAYGPDGALYFNEGFFLNTMVETPYGPVRSYTGATYRFEPRTWKLEHYISYPYFNPWGNVFDRWGTHFVADASDGSNYFAPPMTGKMDYPNKHPRIKTFTTTTVRPTAGIELLSSRHFPDQVQGNFLVNNNIGFQGTKQHQRIEQGSGFTAKEVEPLLQSSDPNFRPIDLKFGPDGALYIVDWYNPLVSHGENPPRDPMRDKRHGRVWRITYKDKPLLPRSDLSQQSIPQLLDNLKIYEDRLRYRSRQMLRQQKFEKVLPALHKWLADLEKSDQNYELHLLEALWLFQDFNLVNKELLLKLLESKDVHVRTAATRVLRYWQDRVPNALSLMQKRVQDPEERVRLEAIVALTYFDSKATVEVASKVLNYPTDYYLDYAIRETFTYLKPKWLAGFKQKDYLSNQPKAAAYLLKMAEVSELTKLPQTSYVLTALVEKEGVASDVKRQAIQQLALAQKKSLPVTLIHHLKHIEQATGKLDAELVKMLLEDKGALNTNRAYLHALIGNEETKAIQSVIFAALLTADQSDKQVKTLANGNIENFTNYLNGIALLTDQTLQKSLYGYVKEQSGAQSSVKFDAAQNRMRRSTAYRVLTKIAGNETEKVQLISQLIVPQGELVNEATEIIHSIPSDDLKQYYASETVNQILKYIASEKSVQDHSFDAVVNLGQKLARLLPSEESSKALGVLQAAGTLEIVLKAIPAKMLFDREEIIVKAGRKILLTFENPDMMPHNVVFVKPGSDEKVGNAADAMGNAQDGFQKHFVPALPEVLFYTPLVNSGGEFKLEFRAPIAPGDYPYLCTFPGHWRVMRGILHVE
jgi:glucose/arabinose dehydrogenase/azurin